MLKLSPDMDRGWKQKQQYEQQCWDLNEVIVDGFRILGQTTRCIISTTHINCGWYICWWGFKLSRYNIQMQVAYTNSGANGNRLVLIIAYYHIPKVSKI